MKEFYKERQEIVEARALDGLIDTQDVVPKTS
jgi:hypothetical protein